MSRIVCFGEVLLRLSAAPGEMLFQSPHLRCGFAGAEANVAASLSRLGHNAEIVTVLPANNIGEACRDALRREGVGVSHTVQRDGRLGLYYFTPGAMMRPAEVAYDRAHSAFAASQAEEFDWDAILAGADWLHLSGLTAALGDGVYAAMLAAAEAAHRAGARLSFDYNYRRSLWVGRENEAPRMLAKIARRASLLFASPSETAAMCGAPAQETFAGAARQAFAHFADLRHYATTAREAAPRDNQLYRGSLAVRDGREFAASARLDGIVDRIGAGDAFAAGALHGAAMDAPPQDIVSFAVAAAGLKHSVYGDFNPFGEDAIRRSMNEGWTDVRR